MKMIEKMLDRLEDEVEGARNYAEMAIDCKARGNMNRANRYKEMANDELNHAGYLRDMYIIDVDEIKKVYQMTEEEKSAWDHGNKRLTDEMAMVKHMLTM